MATPESVDLSRVAWHVSSRSNSVGGQCVEAGPVRDGSGRVAVRHSYHPGGATFVYNSDEWDALVTGIKRGDFDVTR